jgi:Outer membrane protein
MRTGRGRGRALRAVSSFIALSLAAPLVVAAETGAADAQPTLSLDQALVEAADSGYDLKLALQSLGAARLQRSLDLAKQGLSLSATGSYAAADDFGTASSSATASTVSSLVAKAESAASGGVVSSSITGIAQGATGGLSLSTPLTKVGLSLSQSNPPSSTAAYASTTLGLTATQTLWDGHPGGQYRATLEKSGLTIQGKELSAAQSRSAAVAKVKQAYVTMLTAQRDLAIKRQVYDKQSKLLAQIQAVYALKQASDIDLKTARINARGAEIDVATADKTYRLANERLAVILGRNADSRFTVAEVPDPALPAASIDEAIQVGLQKRVDLAQYGISARSSRIDAALAKASAQPGVTLSGGGGAAFSWNATPMQEAALSLGAKISLPILDSGAADLQAKTAEAQAQLYDLQAAQLQKTLASDIRDYFETAQLSAEKIELARQSADLAEAQFDLVKAQNQFGTATTQDVLTASVTAATAEVNYGTARNTYLLAELSLETAMGL